MTEQANYDSKWVKNFVSDFQKALECPVCLDVVKKPFKQCARGHLVCVPCLGIYRCCPTCEEEFLLDNPVCIKNLLEHLPRSCCYNGEGCKAMVRNINDHEKFCGFRRIKCRGANCEQNVLAKELSEHITIDHPNLTFIKTDRSQQILWPNYQSKQNCGGLYVSLFDNLFCISMDNSDNDWLKVTFESFPIGIVDDDYYAKISFSNNNFGYMYTLKAFPVEESEHDSDLPGDKTQNNKEEPFCMKVPKSMLYHFIQKNGSLAYRVIAFKG